MDRNIGLERNILSPSPGLGHAPHFLVPSLQPIDIVNKKASLKNVSFLII